MPMKRELYPPDWPEIAKRVKDAADWCCQSCFLQCRRPGEPLDTHRRTLTVAHLDHDPANYSDENLRALCSRCHLQYDAKHHARNAAHTRRRRQEARGQGALDM